MLGVTLSRATNRQKKIKMKMQDKVEKKIEQKNLREILFALINLEVHNTSLAF